MNEGQEELSAEEMEGQPVDSVLEEQMNDEEFGNAFDEVEVESDDDNIESATEKKENTDGNENESGEDEGSDQNDDTDDEEKGEKKDGEESDEENKSDLLSRAARFEEKDSDEGDEKQDDNKDTADKDESGGNSALNFDDLPKELLDEEIEVDGEKTTMREFFETYPEIAKTQMAIQKHLFGDKFNQFVQNFNDLQKSHQKLVAKQAHNDFMAEVRKNHSDVDTIIASDEFKLWVNEQPKAVRRMVMQSSDVEDATAILDAYKESRAKDTKNKSGDGAKKRRDIHKSTVGGSSRSKGKKADKDDFDSGWEIPVDD